MKKYSFTGSISMNLSDVSSLPIISINIVEGNTVITASRELTDEEFNTLSNVINTKVPKKSQATREEINKLIAYAKAQGWI